MWMPAREEWAEGSRLPALTASGLCGREEVGTGRILRMVKRRCLPLHAGPIDSAIRFIADRTRATVGVERACVPIGPVDVEGGFDRHSIVAVSGANATDTDAIDRARPLHAPAAGLAVSIELACLSRNRQNDEKQGHTCDADKTLHSNLLSPLRVSPP